MAALELRNKTYRIVFMYDGKKHAYSLDTGERDIAEGLRGGIERTLMLLEQQALTLPKGADIIEFVKKGGREAPKPEPARERIQLGSLREGYLEALGNGSIEENSLATVRMHLNHFAESLGPRFDVQRLTMGDLQEHINKRRQLSPVTLKKEMASFRGCWNWGVHAGKIAGIFPSRGLRYPKGEERPPFMTKKEIERKIAAGGLSDEQAAGLWDSLYLTKPDVAALLVVAKEKSTQPFVYPLCCVAAHTGARRSELLRALIGDIDFDANIVTIREKKRAKGQRTTRRVPLTPFLADVLRQWLLVHPGGPHLFCQSAEVARSKKRSRTTGHRGGRGRPTSLKGRLAAVRRRTAAGRGPLTKDEVHDHVKRTLAESDWKMMRGLHTLRHSFISVLASCGTDQRLIDEWVGHQTEQQRRRHRHLLPSVQQQAILSAFG